MNLSSRLLRWLSTVNGGQLATLWAACLLFSALAVWLLASADARNHADRRAFEAQHAEYTADLNRYRAEVTAYRDSANELSALNRGLRGNVRPDVISANKQMVQSYLDLAKTSQVSVELYSRLLDIHSTEGALDLHHRQARRRAVGTAAAVTALIAVAGLLWLTWLWFGQRRGSQTGVNSRGHG